MFGYILLINITYYFVLITITYVYKHVSVWVFCKFEGSVIEARIGRWQLINMIKEDVSWKKDENIIKKNLKKKKQSI